MTNDAVSHSIDEAQHRQHAVIRSWICPGAGFAFVGNWTFAVVTFLTTICFVLAIAWVSLQPTAAPFWTVVAVFVMTAVLWLVEQISIKKIPCKTSGSAIQYRSFVAAASVMWLATIVAIGLLVTSFGSLRMAGSGMAPTIEKGELLIYHKRVDWRLVKSSATIVYENADDSAWGQPG